MACVCNRCNLDCKYPSQLQRHQQRKKQCKITNNNYKDDNDIEVQNADNFKDKIKTILETNNVNLDEHSINLIDALSEDRANKLIEFNNSLNVKTYECNECNKKFSNHSNLRKHIRLNRCNGNTTSSNASNIIQNSNNISNSNNTTINNNLNNSNNNTNITNNNAYNLSLNAFGCENIDNINKNDLLYIFNDSKYLTYKLCDFVYVKNKSNQCFYKYNINDKIVSVLNPNMDITHLPEFLFRENLRQNIFDISIELFHKYKNELTEAELCKCMSKLLQNETNNIANQETIEQNREMIDAIIKPLFRNDNILQNINGYILLLSENQEKYKEKIKETKQNQKYRTLCLNEYCNKPEEGNNDVKNLNKIKIKVENRN